MVNGAGTDETPYISSSNNFSYNSSTGDFSLGSSSLIASNQVTVKTSSIALGYKAGYTNQAQGCVAIGTSAGGTGQGQNSIAIGAVAGQTNQHDNSIIINARGPTEPLNSDASNALYIAPIRQGTEVVNSLYYDTTNKEILYNPISASFTGNYYLADMSVNFTAGNNKYGEQIFTTSQPTLITIIIPTLTTNDVSYSLLAVPFASTDVSNSNYTIFNSSNGGDSSNIALATGDSIYANIVDPSINGTIYFTLLGSTSSIMQYQILSHGVDTVTYNASTKTKITSFNVAYNGTQTDASNSKYSLTLNGAYILYNSDYSNNNNNGLGLLNLFFNLVLNPGDTLSFTTIYTSPAPSGQYVFYLFGYTL
jgi:hypothetical protein